MSTTEERALAVIDEKVREQDDRVQRAIDRGGLPTEDELDQVYAALGAARDLIGGLAWRVEGIAESADGSDLPFTVTLHDIGVVAVIAEDVRRGVEHMLVDVDRIEQKVSCLEAVRQEQNARKAAA